MYEGYISQCMHVPMHVGRTVECVGCVSIFECTCTGIYIYIYMYLECRWVCGCVSLSRCIGTGVDVREVHLYVDGVCLFGAAIQMVCTRVLASHSPLGHS